MSPVAPKRHRPRLAASVALGALCLIAAACEQGQTGRLDGHARLSLTDALPPGVESLTFRVRLSAVASGSTAPYIDMTASGSDVMVIPCLGGPSGQLTQASVDATVKFKGDAIRYAAHGTALFTCRTSLDERVSLVLDVFRPEVADVGGVDVTVQFGGSQCTSTLALRGDDFLAVCARSSCDSGTAAFVFSNVCQGLDKTPTDVWTCGTYTDWTLFGAIARAQYVIPDRDFSALFGLAAVPRQLLAKADLTLTDAAGDRRVFGTVARLFATLQRKGGVLTPPALDADQATDHIALLDVPGVPGQQILLEADDTATGGRALVWTRLGGCRVPALGSATWTLHPIDLRLDGLSAVKVLLAPTAGGVATAQARCAVTAGASGAAVVTCGAPTALSGTP